MAKRECFHCGHVVREAPELVASVAVSKAATMRRKEKPRGVSSHGFIARAHSARFPAAILTTVVVELASVIGVPSSQHVREPQCLGCEARVTPTVRAARAWDKKRLQLGSVTPATCAAEAFKHEAHPSAQAVTFLSEP